MGKELSIRDSRALTRHEGQALVAIQRAQYDGAVRTARGIAQTQTVAMVGDSALDAYGQVAIKAEQVVERSPWAARGASNLVDRIERKLGRVIDDLDRWP